MANFYKNQGFVLNTTSTTVLTINASSVAIVKSISVTNDHNSSNLVEFDLYDASATTNYKFYNVSMSPNTTDQAAGQILNLEAGDSILAQAEVTGVAKGVISYLLIDRSQENG